MILLQNTQSQMWVQFNDTTFVYNYPGIVNNDLHRRDSTDGGAGAL